MKDHTTDYIALSALSEGINYREVLGAEPIADKEKASKGELKAREEFERLKQSILKEGLLQPLVVQPGTKAGTYRVAAGHRRLAAIVQLAEEKKWNIELETGETCVACVVLEPSDNAKLSGILAGLAENAVRSDLQWYELAEGADAAIKAGAKQSQVAHFASVSKGYMSKLVKAKQKIRPKHWKTLTDFARAGTVDLPVGPPGGPRQRKSVLHYALAMAELGEAEQDRMMADTLAEDIPAEGNGEGNGKGKTERDPDAPRYKFPIGVAVEIYQKLVAAKHPAAEVVGYMLTNTGVLESPWPGVVAEPEKKKRGPKKASDKAAEGAP